MEKKSNGWYYLKDHVQFPFKANCNQAMLKSPLKSGKQVNVLRMAPESESAQEETEDGLIGWS
ncbi:calcium-binding protein [Paenibacillus sp. URB8-2]|uniref:calcium-binding protein n=1 Tax=Paenibacillus sp. URB8-2 TaxID=2741301 RepID=UPI0015C0870F